VRYGWSETDGGGELDDRETIVVSVLFCVCILLFVFFRFGVLFCLENWVLESKSC
jgi:hypothetical protein